MGSGVGRSPIQLKTPSAPPPASVTHELGDLFQGKYEPPRPVTRNTLEAIQRKPRAQVEPSEEPDPDALREELAGLFPTEEE